MRDRLRFAPAWLVVLTFTMAALATRLLTDSEVVRLVVVGLLLVGLAIALIMRADGEGWGIYGVMVLVNLLMQATPWPLAVEAPLYLVASAGIVWAIFDRDRSSHSPLTATD
jgi:hypothetical protein